MRQFDAFKGDVDVLSLVTRRVLSLDIATAYGELTPREAGPEAARAALEGIKPAQLLSVPVCDESAAATLLSALWLWHDFLDESHRISQAIETPTGSFWHAVMHRREGDFSNAKYWYAKAADHPMMPSIAAQAGTILNPLPADKRLLKLALHGWNGAGFVDLVESVHDRPGDELHRVCVALQQLEWRAMFDFCIRGATTG